MAALAAGEQEAFGLRLPEELTALHRRVEQLRRLIDQDTVSQWGYDPVEELNRCFPRYQLAALHCLVELLAKEGRDFFIDELAEFDLKVMIEGPRFLVKSSYGRDRLLATVKPCSYRLNRWIVAPLFR
jgi:hypothetical protein